MPQLRLRCSRCSLYCELRGKPGKLLNFQVLNPAPFGNVFPKPDLHWTKSLRMLELHISVSPMGAQLNPRIPLSHVSFHRWNCNSSQPRINFKHGVKLVFMLFPKGSNRYGHQALYLQCRRQMSEILTTLAGNLGGTSNLLVGCFFIIKKWKDRNRKISCAKDSWIFTIFSLQSGLCLAPHKVPSRMKVINHSINESWTDAEEGF